MFPRENLNLINLLGNYPLNFVVNKNLIVKTNLGNFLRQLRQLKLSVRLIRQDIGRLEAERMGKKNVGSYLQDRLLAAR